MLIYAGIDEAGYGPFFGPLVVGRSIFAVEPGAGTKAGSGGAALDASPLEAGDAPADMWKLMGSSICRTLAERRKKNRIAINDSKKLHSQSAGIRHLELGVLAFAALAGRDPAHVGDWLDCVGEQSHRQLGPMVWYSPTATSPWAELPTACTPGELAVARSMLQRTAEGAGIKVLDLGAAVVFEDRFNRMAAATRSKASLSFTFVSGHLVHVWEHYGQHHPAVVVDRQSGRTHYRELLAMTFPNARVTEICETPLMSCYRLEEAGNQPRAMTVCFRTEAEEAHLPVAMASMVAKYTRELLMARFQQWFERALPNVKPTAGYGTDANRFWRDVQPHLAQLRIDPQLLRRMC